jgi:hypothetical protein
MADIQTEEGWHTVEDGHKLYTKTWKVNIRRLPNKAQETDIRLHRQPRLQKRVWSLSTASVITVLEPSPPQ